MSIFCFIYKALIKKLSGFKNVHKYTGHYHALFDNVSSFLTKTSIYTQKSSETYSQAIILMKIGTDYLALVLPIQKDWKDKTTNLAEAILQIIRYFEFIKGNKKTRNVIQVSSSTFSTNRTLKNSCRNLE